MKKSLICLLLGVALLPLSGQTISRIGGGKIASSHSGFEAGLSPFYQEIKVLNETFKVYASTVGGFGLGSNFGSSTLIFAELDEVYPELKMADRAEARELLLSLGYFEKTKDYALNPCISVFHRLGNDTHQFILAWGGGKGFEVSYSTDSSARSAAQKLVGSVVLSEGVCGWN